MSAAVATAKATDIKPAEVEEAMQVDAAGLDSTNEDLYTRLKTLQRQLEFLEIQVSSLYIDLALLGTQTAA
jgi:hypothetical protein